MVWWCGRRARPRPGSGPGFTAIIVTPAAVVHRDLFPARPGGTASMGSSAGPAARQRVTGEDGVCAGRLASGPSRRAHHHVRPTPEPEDQPGSVNFWCASVGAPHTLRGDARPSPRMSGPVPSAPRAVRDIAVATAKTAMSGGVAGAVMRPRTHVRHGLEGDLRTDRTTRRDRLRGPVWPEKGERQRILGGDRYPRGTRRRDNKTSLKT